MNILGWVIWVIVLVLALGHLANKNSDGGVRYMMHAQGWILLIGIALTFSYWSKFNLIWIYILAFISPPIIMQNKMKNSVKQYEKQLRKSAENDTK